MQYHSGIRPLPTLKNKSELITQCILLLSSQEGEDSRRGEKAAGYREGEAHLENLTCTASFFYFLCFLQIFVFNKRFSRYLLH